MKKQRSIDIIRFLPSLFRYADVAKCTGYPNVFLTRAIAMGYVIRVMRGAYLNMFKTAPGIEEVACYLRAPAYISCEWALHYHHIILQAPSVCTTITLSTSVGNRYKVNYKGTVIEYSKLSDKLFFGFESHEGFNLAYPEKALLDVVYLRKKIPFQDELEIKPLDMNRLNKFAAIFPKTIQRIMKKGINFSFPEQN